MKNEEYWKKRQEEKLTEILDDAQITSDYISNIYSKACRYTQNEIKGIYERYRDGHGLSNDEAKRLLSTLTNNYDYNELKRKLQSSTGDVRKELLKKLDSPAYQYRIKRLENMHNQLDQLMKEVYSIEKDKSTDCYINSAFNAYYKDVYNIQQGMNIAYQFDNLDSNLIDKTLKSKWSGKNYSDRIWNNTNELADSLKDEMMLGVLTNKTEKEMADTIMNKFAVGAYQARRLIQTESAAMSAFADQLAFEDAGIDKQMFIAVHDSRTSKICQQHDRSIVETSKAQVGVNVPPLHPNCRSHMIPYIEGVTDVMKKRQRNPITGRDEVVDVKENYDQWLKRQQETHGVDTVNTFMKKTKNLSNDRKQYKSYINVLDKENMPSSLSKFQDLKYNDVSKWGLLKDYKKSRSSNMISAFTSFEQYVDYKKRIENEIIGLTTSNGLTVQLQSKHFIERVFGTNEDPDTKSSRSGVSLENIKDALIHGKDSIDKKDETVVRYTSNNCCVTLNKNTGTLIQVNPISRKRVRK